MKFRLTTLLWVVALIATAVAAVGSLGFIACGAVILMWNTIAIELSKQRKSSAAFVFIGTAILLTLFLPTLPSQSLGDPTCANNLKQLALAVHNYCDSTRKLPLAHTVIQGKPGHSWRMQIVPYLESTTWYAQVDFGSPWDSQANKKIWSSINFYRLQCPLDPSYGSQQTSYLAVVDDRTMWPPDRARSFSEFRDGTYNTIMFIEVHDRDILWPEPRDLGFAEAVDILTAPASPADHEIHNGFFYKPSRGVHVALADGSVELLRRPLTPEMALALLTVAGGEDIDHRDLDRLFKPELNWARISTLAAFVGVSLLPAARIGRSGKSDAKVPQGVDAEYGDA